MCVLHRTSTSLVLLGVLAATALLGVGTTPVSFAAQVLAAPSQQAELLGSDTTGGNEFGYFTAVNGNTILIGAPYHPGGGRAYVFTHSGNTWKQTAILKANDTGGSDVFGVDGKIDRSGSELIVGADEAHGTGAAYIFTKTASGWRQAAELRGTDATPGNHYGLSVAISGSNAIVSTEDDNQAYIYHNTGSRWVQTAELKGSDTQPGDEFGFWVGIDGTTAVVGADKHGSGAIYVFNQSGSQWTQTAKLTGSDLSGAAHFGQNLAISGDTIVVNAPYMDSSAGRIYVFSKASGSWTQTAELKGNDTQAGNWFGWYVSIDGNTIAAGASKTPNGGRTYVFTNSGGVWRQTAEYTGWDTGAGDQLGASTGVSGSTAVAGAFDHQGGRAYAWTGSGTASASIIPIRVKLKTQVPQGAAQTVTVTTMPGAAVSMRVTYPGTGGFGAHGTADGQGAWSYSWTPSASKKGTAVIAFAVTSGSLTRHFTKRFSLVGASGGSGTISIHGPTQNAYDSNFNETITGTASGGANYVIAGEQLNPAGGCASTVAGEAAKGPLDWMQWPTGNGPVHGQFSLVARFYAANGGRHGMCAYLVNRTTSQVYASASQWWTNAEVGHPVPGSGTIGITGPTQNAYHTYFNQTVSGTASGGANYVISGEQTSQLGGCASTYLSESGKSDWVRWPTGTGSVHGHFSLVAKFYAQNHNKHAICSYLINQSTKQTYASAAHFWSNA